MVKNIEDILANAVTLSEKNIPEIVSSIGDKTAESLDDIASAIELNGSNGSFFNINYIIIAILLVWTVVIISIRFELESEETKKDIEFVNTTLFGNTGVIPVIVGILAISMISSAISSFFTDIISNFQIISDRLSLLLKELSTTFSQQ